MPRIGSVPVKGLEGYFITKKGLIISLQQATPTIISPSIAVGYYRVTLRVDNVKYERKVHRLVAEAFIPNPDNKPCVNHIDGNKLNNHVSNLEWVTHSENNLHANATGLRYRKVDKNLAILIKEQYSSGSYTQRELAKIYNIDQKYVWQVLHNKVLGLK